jgi:Spy/CpxP family protein refolding chaperone
MKTRNLLITALVALTLLATPLLVAGPHGRGHRDGAFGPLGMLGHAKEELNLSDQQVDEIKAIFRQVHEQNAEARQQLRGGLKDITAALLENPNNIAGAQAILDQQTQAERTMKLNVLNATSKALNVLTAEQRAKLGTMIEKRMSKREERRSR